NTNLDIQQFARAQVETANELFTAIGGKEEGHAHHQNERILNSKPIITGVLSYGMSVSVCYTPFLDQSNYFELRAVVERSQKNAHNDYPAIISYNKVEDLLADDLIELVVVNTPNDTHVDFARKALLAGKHVLIEKPFAPTVKDAEQLFELAAKVGKKVLPYHNRR